MWAERINGSYICKDEAGGAVTAHWQYDMPHWALSILSQDAERHFFYNTHDLNLNERGFNHMPRETLTLLHGLATEIFWSRSIKFFSIELIERKGSNKSTTVPEPKEIRCTIIGMGQHLMRMHYGKLLKEWYRVNGVVGGGGDLPDTIFS